MKLRSVPSRLSLLSLALVAATPAAWAATTTSAAPPRIIESFDAGWKFSKGDTPDAAKPEFNDTAWQTVDVPHDWAIEGPFDQNAPVIGAGAYLPSGVGWYRKTFPTPADAATKRAFIEFEGVMAFSDVYLNGTLLGHRPFGYDSFQYELTGHLNTDGKPNVLSVRTDTSVEQASRWYAGAGIYRHVRLVTTNFVHLDHWGVVVTTSEVSTQKATLHLQATIVNDGAAPVSVMVKFAAGPIVSGSQQIFAPTAAQTIAPGQTARFEAVVVVNDPKLWNLESPLLYDLSTGVFVGGTDSANLVDNSDTTFGIRDAHFEPATGFWLNGKNLKLLGVCVHGDGSAFGTAVPLDVWRRRLAALRTLGVNAIRTAHNPPDPGFLDLCDQMGFLVMEEAFDCWSVGKPMAERGYYLIFNEWSKTDLRDMVRRDRNHPSIVLYSVGNEIHDTPQAEKAKAILAGLVQVCHENDPSRPVTQALFRPTDSHDYTDGLADLLDVVGTNYRDKELIAAQLAKPTRMIVGTENTHDAATWVILRDSATEAGQFIWAGIDYLGEARVWPMKASAAGLIDRLAVPRARGFERQSWWATTPVVHIARRVPVNSGTIVPISENITASRRLTAICDWNPANTGPHPETVEIYSNADSVELFLNGQSLGSKPINANATARTWNVTYAPGTLRAVASNHGTVVATDELRSAGAATKLVLASDHAKLAPGFDHVAFVSATVVDANGIRVPGANQLVTYSLSGPGVIAAVDNGDNASNESFRGNQRSAFDGVSYALLRTSATTGTLTLTATADGLAPATITLEATTE